MKRISFIVLLSAIAVQLFSQIVTTTPSPIPVGYTDEVVLTYDPTAGNGGMAKATACYSHIGLLTEKSKNTSDWKYIKVDAWGKKTEPQWTKVGNYWQLTINNLNAYFGCPTDETITALIMVFHDGNGDNSMQGKTANGKDIIIYLGKETTDDDIWSKITLEDPIIEARPKGVEMGIYYDENDPTTVTLCTYAAGKASAASNAELQPAQHVYLIGDMTNWELNKDYQLKRDGNYFWIKLTGLKARKEYRFQYAVMRADGVKKQVSDLFSEKVLCKDEDEYEPRTVNPYLIGYPSKGADGGYVSVLQTGKKAYEWSDATLNFNRPDKNNLVIYELWIYDYTPARSIAGLMSRLDYIQNLGVNAIELMPVTEFDGNYNWGYSPNHYFALDKAYGTPEQMKQLVDECHKRGIAVILDMVFNHVTGNNPMNKLYPYGSELAYNPWFNVTAPHKNEDGGVEYYQDWNHDFAPVRNMCSRALQYWLTEYKVDGFRMDLSHGFCGPNCNNRYNNLKEYYNAVKAVSPDAYFIQEYWGGGYPYQSDLINDGMLCWTGNGLSNAYGQLAMGYTDNSSIVDANRDGYVAYNESHDEERNFYKAKTYGPAVIKNDTEKRINRVPAVMAFNTLLNGSHMLYQFGELGYDYSIDNNGRTGTKPQPATLGWLTWGHLRMQQYEKVAQAIQLRTRLLPQVFAGNPTTQSLASSFVRTVRWGNEVYVAANFSPDQKNAINLPSGTWYDYYEQTKANTSTYVLEPGEVKIFTGKQLPLPVVDGSQTGLVDIYPAQNFQNESYKVLYNGQLRIIRNGQVYDAAGRRVE
ncbi:MAG: hypothetical protein IJS00_06350 [Paludibacteraceae bacterium]|nr:hypothetical protein [Paludibacteraceae bacterium]